MQPVKRLATNVCIAITAAIALASPQPVLADAKAEARKAMQSAYDKSNAAAAKRDINGTLANYAADYSFTDGKSQKHTLPELKAQLTQIFQMAKEIHATTTISSFSLKGNSATVTVVEHASISMENPQKPEEKAKLDLDSKSEDLWTKTPNGWRKKSTKEISSKQSLNGKPIVPPKQ